MINRVVSACRRLQASPLKASPIKASWLRPLLLGSLLTIVSNSAAHAHVKWFCAFDVAGQPRGLENVLCADFELLTLAAVFFLLSGCLAEGTPIGTAMINSLNRVTVTLRDNTDLVMRAICGFFFVSLWAIGGIILTPELKTASTNIPLVQLAIAGCMLSRRTLPLAGAGIVFLFGVALWNYGIFHLADYPIFLSVALYLVLKGFDRELFGQRPVDVIRYGAAITLMWASIEKWAYPEWSFPLFIEHPNLTLGFDPEFYMRAAGVIEFTLAFALIWTPLVRRCAAVMLCGMFISACFEFGKVDVIGHSAIIAVLVAIIADDHVTEKDTQRAPIYAVPAFATALVAFLGLYYVGHAVLFKTTVL